MEQRLPVLLVRQGAKFDKRYVSLFEHLDPITLTDQEDTPYRTRELRYGLKGWTSKLELFAPWNKDLRPCFFADLDTYILHDIGDILSNPGKDLYLIKDFYRERSNSGLMIIPEETDRIWAEFLKQGNMSIADGDFLQQFTHKRLQDHYSGIFSYKADNLYDAPAGRIVCFHGNPKPHETKGWAGDIWTSSSI